MNMATQNKADPSSLLDQHRSEKERAVQSVDEILALLQQARTGDQSIVPQIKSLLKDPNVVHFTVSLMGGDLAWLVRNEAIKSLSGKDHLVKESLHRQLELMIADIAGPNPTALEKLLADRIGTCWLHLNWLELTHVKEEMSLEKSTYYQRCIDRAQKRYLSAIKALAVVRKLGVPSVQVNIAKKQVNLANAMCVDT